MRRRLQSAKPKLALWMLVAVADMGLLVASMGLATVLLALAGIAAVTFGAGGALMAVRRQIPERRVPVRVGFPANRRQL